MIQRIARTFSTLHQRLLIIVALSILSSMVLLTLISQQTFHSIEKNRLQTSLVSELTNMSNQIDREYMYLVQVSEQMIPQGSIGNMFDKYMLSNSAYEKYDILSQMPGLILPVTLGNYSLRNFFYYSPKSNRTYFSYIMPRTGFNPNTLPPLFKGGALQYNAVHPSSSKALSSEVISVLRPVNIGDEDMFIYAEARSPISELLPKAEPSMSYVFLQLDESGRITYSTDPNFTPGEQFSLTSTEENNPMTGTTGEYYGALRRSPIGHSSALLLPERIYRQEMYTWQIKVVGLCLFALLLLATLSFSLRRLIYKPMNRLEKEIARVGSGDLDAVDYRSGLFEFDQLFTQFSEMKQQLAESIRQKERAQSDRHQLEIEKLMYQINPHFLMNTLNSVHWMAKVRDQSEIAVFISDLSYILSYSLGKTEPTATIRTEVRFLCCYLQLQKQRYDFNVLVDVEEGTYLDTQSARMILQPIAENAIHHGMDAAGTLRVCVFQEPKRKRAVVIIEDDGRGMTNEEFRQIEEPFDHVPEDGKKQPGIGLRFVRSALEAHYGDRAQFSITRKTGNGTRVTLVLPLEEDGDQT